MTKTSFWLLISFALFGLFLITLAAITRLGHDARLTFDKVDSYVGDGGMRAFSGKGVPMAQLEAKAAPPQADIPPGPKLVIERKIIYTAEISLVIEDLAKAQESLEQLIKESKGLIAQSEIQGTTGSPRSGRWKVRLPVENFDSFRNAVAKLGDVIRNSVDSRDVTDEYYDVKQRIKNKKVEEDRLLEHLKKSTGNLKDILDVERELSRVREEVERLEGRMNVLENLISLTTITVNLQERRGYVPAEAPSFGTTIGRTFHGSIDLLQKAGQGVVLGVVAVGPWLVVLAIVLGPAAAACSPRYLLNLVPPKPRQLKCPNLCPVPDLAPRRSARKG